MKIVINHGVRNADGSVWSVSNDGVRSVPSEHIVDDGGVRIVS